MAITLSFGFSISGYPGGVNSKRAQMACAGGSIMGVGTAVFSGNYPTGGESLVGLTPKMTNKPPIFLFITGNSGYDYEVDLINLKVRVRTGAAAQSAFTELTAGAYPGAITGDSITFFGVWPKE